MRSSLARRLHRATILLLLGGLILYCHMRLVNAAEPLPVEELQSGSLFRRVFVPADKPESWPVGDERFLPVQRKKFEQLVTQWHLLNSSTSRTPLHIKSAIYEAELLPEGLLTGTAKLVVSLPSNDPELLPLSPMNLAILAASWLSNPDEEALVGLWQRPEQVNELAVLTKESDTLFVRWQLGATKTDSEWTDYQLKIPVVVPQSFAIVLPKDFTATISDSELLSTESEPSGKTRWLFQLAPRESHQLRIKLKNPSQEKLPLPYARQSTSYQLEPAGLKVVTQLRLDARKIENSELRAVIQGDMRVLKVTIDQQPAGWRVTKENNNTVLVFSRPQTMQPQVIEIHCLAKLRSNTAWRLPKLRFNEIAWTEGTSQVRVSADLELRSLSPENSTLEQIEGISAKSRNSELYSLQEWSPDSGIIIHVGRSQPRFSARSVTKLELGRDEATANVVAMLSSSQGELYQVRAEVAPNWSVDTVTTTPASAMNEWHIERDEDSVKLFFQLNQPVRLDAPVRVEIKARKLTDNPVLPSPIGDLKVIRFSQADNQQQLLQFHTHDSQQLVLTDRFAQAQLAAGEISPQFQELISETADGTIIDVSEIRESEILEPHQQAVQYEADVKIAVEARPDSFQQEYQFDYRLRSGSLTQLLLEFDELLPEDLQWELVGQRGLVVMERIMLDSSTELPNSTVKYSLQLPVAMTKDFRLRASYSKLALPTERCNLVRLPEAIDWQGQLLIRGALEDFLLFDQGWTPTMSLATNAEESQLPVLGNYRLGPSEMRREVATRGLRLKRQEFSTQAPSVIAWLTEYRTLQAANGNALHSVSYSLENKGIGEAKITLPDGAELQEAWLNHRQLEPKQIASEGNSYSFRFDNGLSWPFLTLQYTTRDSALGRSAIIRPVVPKCSFPIQLSRWTLWAPEQYEIDHSAQDYSSRQNHWWKRIFGPLARSRGETVFNPLDGKSWSELWSAPLVEQQSRQRAERLAHELVDSLQMNPDESIGDILTVLTNQILSEQVYSIDRTALQTQGIHAHTTGRELLEPNRELRLLSARAFPLSSYRLALLVSTDSIILTTAERISHWHDQLRPTDTPGVFLVSSDDLSERFDTIHNTSSSDIVVVAQWVNSPQSENASWYGFRHSALDDVGRRAQTIEFVSDLPSLIVRRAFVQQALWFTVLLLTIVLGVWQIAHFPNVMILAGAIAGATCLIVPIQWLTIPQATFLGLVVAAIVRIAQKSEQFGAERLRFWRKASQTTALLCVGSGMLLLAYPTQAQDSTAIENAVPSIDDLPKILVPIDPTGVRQGDDVYLPIWLFEKISRPQLPGKNGGAEFVILSANYQGNLLGNTESEAVDITDRFTDPWTLTWKIESFVPNCRITLPLRRDQIRWDDKAQLLDGLPVGLKWEPDGQGCSMVLPTTGIHRLQLTVQPKVLRDEQTSSIRLQVPPVPQAELSLDLHENIDELRVPGASLQQGVELDSTQKYLLGNYNTIEINWTSKVARNSTASWTRFDQYSWLRVEPTGTYLDTQLSITGYQATNSLLELDISPQLKLITPTQDSPISAILPPSVENPTRLKLQLRSGLPQNFIIPLRFELQRTASVGNIFFPRVRLQGSLPTQNLFAVSVASGLSYNEQVSNDVRSIEPSEFIAAWSNPEGQPLYAFAIGQEDPDWSLQIRPDPQTFSAQQLLRVHCLANVTQVDFEATVENLTGSLFSHTIQIPASLHIDDITVRDLLESTEIPVRWTRVNPTEATLFLARPLQFAHSIQLQGHLHADQNNQIELPHLQLRNSELSEIQMDLYRTVDVQVRWTSPQIAAQETPSQNKTVSPSEIFVGHFSWRSSEAGRLSQLQITKNDRQVYEQSVTTLARRETDWTAILNSQLEVKQGVLTHLKLEAPDYFREPFVLSPEGIGKVSKIQTTPDGQEITVLLSQPALESETVNLQIQGNLSLPPDGRLVAPSLRWREPNQHERFVMIPTQLEGKSIAWQTSGLRRRSVIPSKLRPYLVNPETSRPYRIQQDQFVAEERTSQGPMRNARIRFGKVSAVLNPAGQMISTAELYLQPGRATSCRIQLPKKSQLYQLTVGDLPARRELHEDGTWKVPLGPPFMPRRILVSYRSQIERVEQSLLLVPPKILLGDQSLPMPKTWWDIRTTGNLHLNPDRLGNPISELQYSSDMYQQTAETMQEALPQSLELPDAERLAWTSTWESFTLRAKNRFQSLIPPDNTEVLNAIAEKENLQDTASPTDVESIAIPTVSLAYPPRLPRYHEESPIRTEYYLISDMNGQLRVSVTSSLRRNIWQWFAAAALVSSILAVVIRLRHKTDWHHQLCYWPHVLSLIGGFAWWLLLKPSALGMLVIVLALTSLTLKQWQSFRQTRKRTKIQLAIPTS